MKATNEQKNLLQQYGLNKWLHIILCIVIHLYMMHILYSPKCIYILVKIKIYHIYIYDTYLSTNNEKQDMSLKKSKEGM